LPLIDGIHGRAYDVLINSVGQRFHPETFLYMVEDAKRLGLGIAAFQLVEKGPCVLEFRIKKAAGYSAETEAFLRSRVRQDFDAAAMVTFAEAASIEREPSGKVRVVKGRTNGSEGGSP
jgi:hypothetical protein